MAKGLTSACACVRACRRMCVRLAVFMVQQCEPQLRDLLTLREEDLVGARGCPAKSEDVRRHAAVRACVRACGEVLILWLVSLHERTGRNMTN